MTDDTEIQVEEAWSYSVPAPVAGLASSAQDHRTLVGDIEGTCHLLEPDGKLRTTVHAGGPVRAVRASSSGNCFGVLTENGVLQAFNSNAEPLWELDVEGVETFDLGKTARTVAVGFPGWMSPSALATSPVSAIMGNSILVSRLSLIHSVHFRWA